MIHRVEWPHRWPPYHAKRGGEEEVVAVYINHENELSWGPSSVRRCLGPLDVHMDNDFEVADVLEDVLGSYAIEYGLAGKGRFRRFCARHGLKPLGLYDQYYRFPREPRRRVMQVACPPSLSDENIFNAVQAHVENNFLHVRGSTADGTELADGACPCCAAVLVLRTPVPSKGDSHGGLRPAVRRRRRR